MGPIVGGCSWACNGVSLWQNGGGRARKARVPPSLTAAAGWDERTAGGARQHLKGTQPEVISAI